MTTFSPAMQMDPEASKTEMMAQVFHTLAQPLTELHGRLEFALLRESSAAEMRNAIVAALVGVDRAIGSLCFLRDLADAAEPGATEAADVSRTFREVFDEFRFVAESQQIMVEAAEGPAVWVQADAGRLSHALTLIMDSALAASPVRILLEPVERGWRLLLSEANLHSKNEAQARSLELARRLLKAAQCDLHIQGNEVLITSITAGADEGNQGAHEPYVGVRD
jgi:signal transduction histidine kinase